MNLEAFANANPPPITYPSSKAAFTANKESSILSLHSYISVCCSPAAFIMHNPPFNLPSLSLIKSNS